MVWDLFMSVPKAYLVSSKRIMVCTSGNFCMKFHRPCKMLCMLRRGYYTYGGRNHDVCEFELRFDNGIVKGRGVDDVGLTSCGPTTTSKNSSWDRLIAVVAWANISTKLGNLMRALLPGSGAYTIRGKFDGRRHSIDFTKQCPLGSPWLAHVLHCMAHIGKLQSQHVRFKKCNDKHAVCAHLLCGITCSMLPCCSCPAACQPAGTKEELEINRAVWPKTMRAMQLYTLEGSKSQMSCSIIFSRW